LNPLIVILASLLTAVPQPILSGTTETELGVHKKGNVYAPEVQQLGDRWRMWYGGQGRDGHDRIHLATSTDLKSWDKQGVVLEEPGVNHQNDPSVVRVGDVWWMFYTRAEHGISDEIAAATSPDGLHWERRGVVLAPGEGTAWDSLIVGRPSVLYEEGRFRMWYDGCGLKSGEVRPTSDKPEALLAVATGRAVGYAESDDGLTWKRHGTAPIYGEGAGALHVSHIADGYVMLYESHAGTRWASSRDGLTWSARGILAATSGGEADRGGHVTPFLLAENGRWQLFVGSNSGDWSKNWIGRVEVERVEVMGEK
jgi:sucrose-6-phosphate hydrolase SacC (GH32 family)